MTENSETKTNNTVTKRIIKKNDARGVLCGTLPWDDANTKPKVLLVCFLDKEHNDNFVKGNLTLSFKPC